MNTLDNTIPMHRIFLRALEAHGGFVLVRGDDGWMHYTTKAWKAFLTIQQWGK